MTVIRPNSISGVSSITGSGGDISIFRADGTAADVIVNNITSGVITATHYGSGANLTNLPAANLTGALPAISAANLTSIPAANITGTLPAISAANLTNVPAANITGTLPAIDGSALTGVGVGTADSINTSGIVTATAFVPTTQGSLSHRNLFINGDFSINQYGSSSTTSMGKQIFDRWHPNKNAGTITQSRGTLTSGGAFDSGHRTYLRLTNTSAAGSASGVYVEVYYKWEGQDIVRSGWNYKSPSSFITMSFWIRSSVAMTYPATIQTRDGTAYFHPFTAPVTSANTWTKVTKTFAGNSNLQIDNDNGNSLMMWINPVQGSAYHNNSWNTDGWFQSSGNSMFAGTADTTWGTTAGATWDITGFQLEVGPVATPFEHRSHGEELRRCQRYYQKDLSRNRRFWGSGNVSNRQFPVRFDVEMRDTPSVSFPSTSLDSGSPSANGINRQGYYFNMSGSGRFYEWQHIANAEI